jgi:catechol 2,3-dioxygenase-like lactoylglutathione lyase family enzyme
MPTIRHVLETALYCDDLLAVTAFYRNVLGFLPLHEDSRLSALDAGASTVLLLFQRTASAQGMTSAAGHIPGHDGSGPVHIAFAIPSEEVAAWEARLRGHGVSIESHVAWPRGGTSLYFRDPDGHSVELASPGVWTTY